MGKKLTKDKICQRSRLDKAECIPLGVAKYTVHPSFIRCLEAIFVVQDSLDAVVVIDRGRSCLRRRPGEIILIQHPELREVGLHGLRGHQGEERVDTVLREVVGKGAQEKLTQLASETEGLRIPLTISKAPSSQVIGSEVLGEEPVPTSEGDSITKDGTTDGVTYCKMN